MGKEEHSGKGICTASKPPGCLIAQVKVGNYGGMAKWFNVLIKVYKSHEAEVRLQVVPLFFWPILYNYIKYKESQWD